MKAISILLLMLTLTECREPKAAANIANAEATGVPDEGMHEAWDDLLKKYVSNGKVDYQGFNNDRPKLNACCELLSNNPPNDAWGKNEKLAYWINAYNVFTVKLILDNYPVESIQDLHPTLKIPGVNTVWHKTEFRVGDDEISLNDVEHKVLRKMNEPRIHFAINCASTSCPPLRNEAYTPQKLDLQLTEQAKEFINTSTYNKISANKVELSQIFNWFKSDFTTNGTLIKYLNQYSTTKINADADVSNLEYDWSLNKK